MFHNFKKKIKSCIYNKINKNWQIDNKFLINNHILVNYYVYYLLKFELYFQYIFLKIL